MKVSRRRRLHCMSIMLVTGCGKVSIQLVYWQTLNLETGPILLLQLAPHMSLSIARNCIQLFRLHFPPREELDEE
jgi:hypothetical protein